MRKMILLFSHLLSDEQKDDAKHNYKVEQFIPLPKALQQTWSNISPDINSVHTLLSPIKDFIQQNAEKNDVILIQGDFGAVYEMVNFSKDLELTCIYATTKRIVREYRNENNQTIKKSVFEHRRFREYE